jgi:hypothetical protein
MASTKRRSAPPGMSAILATLDTDDLNQLREIARTEQRSLRAQLRYVVKDYLARFNAARRKDTA